ncbi:MAG: glycine cleavage system aminomethyltransferase GcvT [Bauldia sp.]
MASTEHPADAAPLRETPLAALHRALGARMVPFAGYAMPVQYSGGIIAEHLATRSGAGLFDVSHMGQARLRAQSHAAVAAALEAMTPGDFAGLTPGRIRYSLLLNPNGGIVDDLMATRPAGEEGVLDLIVNAARKDVDYAFIRERLPRGATLEVFDDRALIAVQGPKAAEVFSRHVPGAAAMGFMTAAVGRFDGIDIRFSRSGYTGEDGYEISVAADRAADLWSALAKEPEVTPVGLGARDSLRLEAGLCLYGHDIDETTSPIEGNLLFAVAERRRAACDFPGGARIGRELSAGPARLRVGIRVDGKAPVREGATIEDGAGKAVGVVTSGGYGASLGGPIAMGYVPPALAAPGTPLAISVRGKAVAAAVAPLPFVPHRYFRKPKPTAGAS